MASSANQLTGAPAESRNWLPVYLEGDLKTPVGKLYTNADRHSVSAFMVVMMSDLITGDARTISLKFITLNQVYAATTLEHKQRDVIQQMLDNDYVPTWANWSKDDILDQYHFKWKVLQVSQANWPRLFDWDLFEPL